MSIGNGGDGSAGEAATARPRLLAFGLGYSARRAAALLASRGWAISGTSRSPEGAAAIGAGGWRGLTFDGTAPSVEVGAALAGATHVLASIPPGDTGDPALLQHAADLARAPRLEAVVYLSTVGVYGDHGGGWVDEDTPPAPTSDRACRRLAAEAAWRRLAEDSGRRLVVLRLPGIYGPGRSVIDALRQGTARRIVKPGQVFNRAHVDDIAAAIEAALLQSAARGVYNVADDEPAPPEDVVVHAARLLGLPPPPPVPFAEAKLSPMAASFYAEAKRVSNRRLKTDLGIVLRFPTYREGLAAIAREGGRS